MPQNKKEGVELWMVFQRVALSLTFPTTSAVMLDRRTSLLRKPLSERVACALCPGIAAKRMLCQHETELVDIVKRTKIGISDTNYTAMVENVTNMVAEGSILEEDVANNNGT